MNDRKNQTTTSNEIKLQSDLLTDLQVADEEAQQTNAGTSAPNGRLFVATNVGVF